MPELALSHRNALAPASSPNSVLQLVFDYLSLVPGPACTSKELIAYLHCLQRVTTINREWRAVASPLFYHIAYVAIGPPLDSLDMYDSEDKYSDDEDSVGKSNEGSTRLEAEGHETADAVDKGNFWGSDNNEALLSTIGLSRNGVNIGQHSNVGLICMGQIAGQLLHQLVLAQFSRYEWREVERLRIDMCDSSSKTRTNALAEQCANAVNESLSASLPSLSEIEYYRPHSKSLYGCVLIEQLIMEWLQRPESLRTVRVKADCWSVLTDNCNMRRKDLPVFIECMEIDGHDETYLMPAPILVADTLVELKLNHVIAGFEWKLFEHLGNLSSTEEDSGSSKPSLIFSSLRSLALNFTYLKVDIKARAAIFIGPIFSVPDLVNEYHRLDMTQSLEPRNSSLCVLNAYGMQYFSGYDDSIATSKCKRVMAPELNHYRSLLVGLVCRLPALEMLRVSAKSVEGVNESIGALIEVNACPEHKDIQQ
ncbi:hypothetical protein GGF41_002008, partial [Coemansia sp. RSA 2531]